MRPALPRIVQVVLALCAAVGLVTAFAGCGTVARTTAAPLPPGTTSSVTIQADATAYSPSQPIGVTIHNVSGTTYYLQTSQSECTPIEMQRQVGKSWQNVMPCTTGAPQHSVALTPGLSEPFTLAPGNQPSDPNAWAPGVYRFALQLTTTANGTGAATLVYSPGVRIAAPSA